MAKYTSGRQKNLKVGISSYSENLTSLEVIGKVGIGTTNAQSNLYVVGNGEFTGVVTAGYFVGDGSGLTNLGSSATISYASTAGIATYATSAGIATYADTAGIATYATSAGIATYATSAGIATVLQNARTFEITGDIIASPISFNGNGNVSLAATIQPNSVDLGTDTTGDYVQSISGTSNQITVTGGTGESSAPTLSIPNQFTIPQDLTVTRDVQINRNLNVTGNITIGGTAAYINVQQLQTYDQDLVLGFRTDVFGNDASSDNTANHGGIAIASTEGSPLVNIFIAGIETTPSTYKKIMWFKGGEFAGLGTDAWLINYAVGIGSTQFPTGTILAAGSVQFTENDLSVVRNVNASGIITAIRFSGTLDGYALTAGISTYATSSGYALTSGISTVAQGLTGTPNLNIGVVTATSYNGSGTNLTGIVTSIVAGTGITIGPTNGTGQVTIYSTAQTIPSYALVAGIATYATTAGVATYATSAGIATYATTAGVATYATSAGISSTLTSTASVNTSGIITATSFSGSGISLTGIVTSIVAGTGITIGPTNGTGQVTIYSTAASGSVAYADKSGISTNVIGGIASISQLGVSGLATFSGLTTFTSSAYFTGAYFGDNNNLYFGSTNDLRIYHSGGNAYIKDVGRGDLILASDGNGISLRKYADADQYMAEFLTSGPVKLYYNNANKFETLSVGATVTGTLFSDQISVGGTVTANSFRGSGISLTGIVTSIVAGTGITIGPTNGTGQVTIYSTAQTIPSYALSAGIATYATSSGIATYATSSGIATYATSSGIATYATSSGIATYATSSGIATYATSAGISTISGYSSISGIATVAQNLTESPNITVSSVNSSGIITATQLVSNVPQGTSPITVGSSTLVSNLNANYLNGQPDTYYTNASNLNSGTISKDRLSTSNSFNVLGDLNVSGNITIGGTTGFIAVNELIVRDKDIVIGYTTNSFNQDVSNDTTANHGGIAVASTEGTPLINMYGLGGINSQPNTYKQIMWIKSGTFSGLGTDVWMFNYGVGIGSTQVPNGVRLAVGGVQVTDNTVTADTFSGTATYATNAGIATYADTAGIATYATSSGIATYATSSGIATYATSSGIATYATNIKGGAANQIPYQTNADITSFIQVGTAGSVLLSGGAGSAPYWSSISGAGGISGITIRDEGTSLSTNITSLNFVGSNVTATTSGVAATITVADNLVGTALSISGISTLGTVRISSGIITATSGVVTYYGDGSKLSGVAADYAPNAGLATYVKGGLAGNILYQSAPNITAFLTNGSTGTVLQSNGVGNAPSWVPAAPANAISGLTVQDEGIIVGSANSISTFNFVGGNVTATASASAGIATITIEVPASTGGSGKFDTSIDNVIYFTPTGTLDRVGVGTTTDLTTLPSTAGIQYLVHSIHVANITNGDAEITAAFDIDYGKVLATYSSGGAAGIHTCVVSSASTITIGMGVTGTNVDYNTLVTDKFGNTIILSKPLTGTPSGTLTFTPVSQVASRLPVPVGSAVELLKQPFVLNPSDSIRVQATGVGTAGIVTSTTATSALGASRLTVASATNIAAGQLVSGTGIAKNTYVGVGYTPSNTSVPITKATTAVLSTTPVTFTDFIVPQDGALHTTIVYQATTSTAYLNGTSAGVGIATTATVYYGTGTLYPSVIQSIRVANISDSGDYPVWVGIGNSDTVFNWLAYNMIIPKNSSIELCEAPKRLGIGQSIFAYSDTINAIEIQIAGKQKTA